ILPSARAACSQSGSGAIATKAQKTAAAAQASQRQTTAANGSIVGLAGKSSELSHARHAMRVRCAAIQAGRKEAVSGGVSDRLGLPRAKANTANAATSTTMNRNPKCCAL